MALNDEQKLALKTFIDSDLFKRAEEECLKALEQPVDGLAPEIGMKLAMERGARDAFRQLKQICRPATPISQPTPKSLTRTAQ